MMPLYGFLEGDTLGLLILAAESETMAELAAKLQAAAAVRVAPLGPVHVEVRGARVADTLTVSGARLGACDRFDVRRGR
jgi:hypothetical protein